MTPEERFAAAAQFPEAGPELWGRGGMTMKTPQAIERYRMIVCLSGLKLEANGIRTNRHVSCLVVARRDYGIKARNARDAHDRLRAKMLNLGIIVEANT